MTDPPLIDPLDALRSPAPPVAPDPGFARALRSRLERALLDPSEDPMTSATSSAAANTTGTGPVATLRALTPYLAVVDARAAVEFYVTAFGAVPRGEPILMDDGRVGHAEVALGDCVLMLADEFPEMGLVAPTGRGGPSQSLRLEVADPDAVVDRAVAAGATLDRPVTGSEHGRGGAVLDPSGHRWMVSQQAPAAHPGDVVYASLWTPDEARARRFYAAVLGAAPPLHGTSGPRTGFLCVAVADFDAAVGRIRAAGGTVGEPEVRPYGRLADGVDDQGLPFAVHEIGGAPPAGFAYAELRVPDAVRARAFYGTVLNWGFQPGSEPGYWHPRRSDGGLTSLGLVGGHAAPVVVPWFIVDDLDAAAETVRSGGGTVVAGLARRDGETADCTDDQGAAFVLLQAR